MGEDSSNGPGRRRYRRAATRGAALSAPKARVARRCPEVARQEILDAAAQILQRRSFRELTIPTLMSHTKIGRSAFYVYFKDVYEVVEALLAGLRQQILAYFGAWKLAGRAPVGALQGVVADAVNIWVVNGSMLAAMLDAAADDARIEAIAADITEAFRRAVADALAAEHAAGRIDLIDFDETAALLVLATQAYLKARLGRAGQGDPQLATATLQALWIRSIYGLLPPGLTN